MAHMHMECCTSKHTALDGLCSVKREESRPFDPLTPFRDLLGGAAPLPSPLPRPHTPGLRPVGRGRLWCSAKALGVLCGGHCRHSGFGVGVGVGVGVAVGVTDCSQDVKFGQSRSREKAPNSAFWLSFFKQMARASSTSLRSHWPAPGREELSKIGAR